MEETKHVSVLLQEAVEALHLSSGDTVIDATLGGGGHTREILKRVLPDGKVIAFDADADALKRFQEKNKSDAVIGQALTDKSLILVHKNYSLLGGVLDDEGVSQCSAVLADLGFSSDQIEADDRGFSFLHNSPLDMRMDQEIELTAEKIVNTLSAPELSQMFRDYGDESESWRIALAIDEFRKTKPITTTDELREIIEKAYPKGKRYRMKIHPATKVFQALRIAVNQEFEHLEKFLTQATERLEKGGRLAVITFHSGEDRRVKQFFKGKAQGCICPPTFPVCRCGRTPEIRLITKKPIVPSEAEMKENPRSRSAKLRVIEKI